MTRPRLVLAPGKEKAVLRRHPWIFSGAVKRYAGVSPTEQKRTETAPQEGDIVDVYTADGQWVATGHYQNESIVCKVLSFDTPDIDRHFLRQRLLSAIEYRRRLGFFDTPDTDVFRLVHAEGDGLPGLVADWYAGNVVLQAHSVGMYRLFPMFTELLRELLPGLVSVFDKSGATLPNAGTDNHEDGYLYGEEREEWEVVENGVHILINPREGQKTGFFIDQRENRRLVQELAKGHRVLNCFGYTGGFSLAALKGGADYVETVDISKKAIALCNRNVELNFGTDAPHQGTVADVLQYLAKEQDASANSQFDFIILDPPAFAKNHRSLQQGLKGYRSINQRAMERIAPGGLLMTFSCSQAVSKEDFQTMIFTAAANAGKKVRIVRQLPHAADHPVSVYHPEGEYLKGLLLEIED